MCVYTCKCVQAFMCAPSPQVWENMFNFPLTKQHIACISGMWITRSVHSFRPHNNPMRYAEWRGDRLKVTQLLRVAELRDAIWASGS